MEGVDQRAVGSGGRGVLSEGCLAWGMGEQCTLAALQLYSYGAVLAGHGAGWWARASEGGRAGCQGWRSSRPCA